MNPHLSQKYDDIRLSRSRQLQPQLNVEHRTMLLREQLADSVLYAPTVDRVAVWRNETLIGLSTAWTSNFQQLRVWAGWQACSRMFHRIGSLILI